MKNVWIHQRTRRSWKDDLKNLTGKRSEKAGFRISLVLFTLYSYYSNSFYKSHVTQEYFLRLHLIYFLPGEKCTWNMNQTEVCRAFPSRLGTSNVRIFRPRGIIFHLGKKFRPTKRMRNRGSESLHYKPATRAFAFARANRKNCSRGGSLKVRWKLICRA